MNVKKNIFLTFTTALISQISSILAAIILPKLLITYFGSEMNGVVSTARQFSTYLAMIDSGMYAATCYRFIIAFKNNDFESINNLFATIGRFFRKVSYAVMVAIVLFGAGYALIINHNTDKFLVFYIFVAYSFGTAVAFWEYFKYNIVLFSAGKQYIITAICAGSSIATVILQYVAIKTGLGIYIAVAVFPIAIILRLTILKKLTLKDNAYLDYKNGKIDNLLIDKKWDSVVLNFADSMKTFSPILAISVFFGAAFVSVYTVYESVLHLGSSVLIMCLNGLTPTLGKNLVKCTDDSKKQFRNLCSVVYLVSGVVCTCFAGMIINFIKLYIGNSADVNYIYPLMAIFMIVNVLLLMIRTGYDLLIKTVGHITELRNGAIAEICISIVMSLLFAKLLGFEYVVLGVIISAAYRTLRMALYCSKKLGYGHFVITDLIKWLLFVVVISAVVIRISPSTSGFVDFVSGCLYVLAITAILYGMVAFVLIGSFRRKIIGLLKNK